MSSNQAPTGPERCPCGTGDAYTDCCGPLLAGERKAATAVQLMRSRFTAFTRTDVDYALATWTPATRPSRADLTASLTSGPQWLRLEIVETTAGGPFDDMGTVEFIANALTAQGRTRLHERSFFVRENGAWLYERGDLLNNRTPLGH